MKLAIPSTNASTTVAYRLSDNTGADAIDAWLQNQCAAELNQSVDFANPNAAPGPISVTVTVSAAGKQAGSPLTDITLPAPLQLQPKLLMAAANPTTTLSGTPAPAPAAGATAATTGSGGTAPASGGTGGLPASEAQPGTSQIAAGPPANAAGGSTGETGTASIQSPGPSTPSGTGSVARQRSTSGNVAECRNGLDEIEHHDRGFDRAANRHSKSRSAGTGGRAADGRTDDPPADDRNSGQRRVHLPIEGSSRTGSAGFIGSCVDGA